MADYQGRGKNLTVGVGFTSEARGGNTGSNPSMDPTDFGDAYKERTNSYSPFAAIPAPTDVGVIYQISRTNFYK
ncbi:hypothetical protein [Pseudochryseolinea flava]|uniref:hypothetical protein n=1 Tax=Pseudochryseolinea flava TaxID=2059302 RepID=UPI0010578AF7|nr:hypothetical protein [Pseudochryseolinea flava]